MRKALQAVPRAYFGAESTIHTMRARGVTVQQGQHVNSGVIRGMQGRRGEIPETYTAVENSMLQGACNMVAPAVESLWAVIPPVGNQGDKPSSSAIRQGPRRAPPVGGGKTPRPPQPFPEDYGWKSHCKFRAVVEGPREKHRRFTAADFAQRQPKLSYASNSFTKRKKPPPLPPRYPDGDGSPWQLLHQEGVECAGTAIPGGYPEAEHSNAAMRNFTHVKDQMEARMQQQLNATAEAIVRRQEARQAQREQHVVLEAEGRFKALFDLQQAELQAVRAQLASHREDFDNLT